MNVTCNKDIDAFLFLNFDAWSIYLPFIYGLRNLTISICHIDLLNNISVCPHYNYV